ncbi:MAG: hypothetical protein ABSB84_14925 [Verrucomicrobiota bacterium]|jgi:hypothetical protein
MTADEFVKIVRKGSDKLRVDDVVFNTGSEEFHGKGLIRISRESIDVDLTINKGEKVPEVKTGIYTKRDYWKLTGIIEDQLQFKCDYVGPAGYSSKSWPSEITKCTFDLHPIDLIPSGWDAMSRQERNQHLKQLRESTPNAKEKPEQTTEEEQTGDFYFYATLFEYPLLASSWGKEVKGETENYEIVFQKEKEDSDLHVSLRSKKEYHSPGEQDDWNKFYAFMKALAFVHGMNAWPYRVEYWRAGQKITDRVTAAYKLSKTSHTPFTKRLSFNAKTGSLKWDFYEPIKKAAAFFETDSALSKEVSEILFLFREADEGVHSEITTIALCSLFENLVRLIFRELNLKEKAAASSDLKLFEEAKSEIADQINQQIAAKGEGFRRLHNIVRSAQLFSIEQMFQAVVNHFGLKWQDDMEIVFNTWKNARNPIAHDKMRADISEDELKEATINESRIAGAINILLLKLFGYSGWMRSSTFEDRYREI